MNLLAGRPHNFSVSILTAERPSVPAHSNPAQMAGWVQRHASFVLFLVALFTGCCQMFHTGIGFGNGNEMASVARSVAATGNYSNPFLPAVTGPTAIVPPLYPLYLALLIKVFGLSPLFVIVASLANVLVNALIAALMPRLSRVFYGDPLPGVFAGPSGFCPCGLHRRIMRPLPVSDPMGVTSASRILNSGPARADRPSTRYASALMGAGCAAS